MIMPAACSGVSMASLLNESSFTQVSCMACFNTRAFRAKLSTIMCATNVDVFQMACSLVKTVRS